MPFTFSHPAIVLPLKRLLPSWLSLSALIIGSTTPDFEYFLNMKMQGSWGHSWGGLLSFNLPVGLVLYLLWHKWVKHPLISSLPSIIGQRLKPSLHFDGWALFKKRWYLILLSLFIGSTSHIVWDGFTHINGWVVPYLPGLLQKWELFGLQIPVYNLLQHSSTILGGVVMVGILFNQPKAHHNQFNPRYWVFWACITGIISAVRLTWLTYPWFYGDLIATAIAAGLWAFIITPSMVKVNA